MTIEINGMARDSDGKPLRGRPEFYRKLLPELGMKPVFDGDKLLARQPDDLPAVAL
jgi:hypothetical protein